MPEGPLVIAGAGIAGLALAAALRRQDVDVRIVEERPAGFSIGGGITLWPNALAALDAIGLGEDVRAAGTAVSTGVLRTSSGRALLSLSPDRVERALGGSLVAIRRGALLDVLQEHVAPGSIRTGVAVRGYQHTDRGVSVGLSDGSRLDAAALVGADGFRSEVARALSGGDLRQRYAGYPAWRAISPVTGLEPVELVGGRKEFGVVPLGDHGVYWFAALREPAEGTAPGGELAHLRTAFAGWPEPVATLLDGTAEDAVTRVDIIDRATPARWQDGPVTVIGDAAHPMRPHLGQGGCQALVDAAVLAPLLARTEPAEAFAEYVSRRRRDALRVVRRSRQVGAALNAPVPVHHLMRLVPDALFLRRLAAIGGSAAFPPTRR